MQNMLQQFQRGKLLSELSTFGIGGPAKLFVEVAEVYALQQVIAFAFQHAIPYLVIGKGSNCLFDDRGFDGLAILNKINFLREEENLIHVGAGYNFAHLGVSTARKGLSGLEFASGIPATVGGAVYMNAGANGKEVADVLESVDFISEEGDLLHLPKSSLSFSYRFSSFQGKKGAIAAACFVLRTDPAARKQQLDIVNYRIRTQPYGQKSAGCVFRNPAGGSAGMLIEQCGLKGKRIGKAVVSPLHANFIVNEDDATAQEVLELAQFVQQTVKEKTGVNLEMEIRAIPFSC